MKEYDPITSKNINLYTHQEWHVNTGNFNGNCPICKKKTKKDDLMMLEFDVSNGLSSNEYCSVCGNIRLQELSDYYANMKKE